MLRAGDVRRTRWPRSRGCGGSFPFQQPTGAGIALRAVRWRLRRGIHRIHSVAAAVSVLRPVPWAASDSGLGHGAMNGAEAWMASAAFPGFTHPRREGFREHAWGLQIG